VFVLDLSVTVPLNPIRNYTSVVNVFVLDLSVTVPRSRIRNYTSVVKRVCLRFVCQCTT